MGGEGEGGREVIGKRRREGLVEMDPRVKDIEIKGRTYDVSYIRDSVFVVQMSILKCHTKGLFVYTTTILLKLFLMRIIS